MSFKHKYYCQLDRGSDVSVINQSLLATRVGKVSGIEVSGRVSGMPEMPGTKPRFWAPETARNCPKLPETKDLEI